MKNIIIAIDGHSSTGKSTLAKMLSTYYNFVHINTGSMYRAVTLNAIRKKIINLNDSPEKINVEMLNKSVDSLRFEFRCDKENYYSIFLNDENVEGIIKLPDVTKYVSYVSKFKLLRSKIINIQQQMGRHKSVVMEGRDIGSVVFPDADLKLFITASIDIRARRRYNELKKSGIDINYSDVYQNIKMRDYYDTTRKNSPLKKVEDAFLVNNSSMTIDEQFKYVVDLIKKYKIF